jgi:mono/diheme cytochrome c family protein
LVTIVPGDPLAEHCRGTPPAGVADLPTYVRLVVYQKTRHGSFLGYGGTMPPFSTESLSDADLASLMTYLRQIHAVR